MGVTVTNGNNVIWDLGSEGLVPTGESQGVSLVCRIQEGRVWGRLGEAIQGFLLCESRDLA